MAPAAIEFVQLPETLCPVWALAFYRHALLPILQSLGEVGRQAITSIYKHVDARAECTQGGRASPTLAPTVHFTPRVYTRVRHVCKTLCACARVQGAGYIVQGTKGTRYYIIYIQVCT